jgi:hypothetical protein
MNLPVTLDPTLPSCVAHAMKLQSPACLCQVHALHGQFVSHATVNCAMAIQVPSGLRARYAAAGPSKKWCTHLI